MFAEDLMTTDPLMISPLDSVHDALILLYQLDVRHLPVVESGVLLSTDLVQGHFRRPA